MSEAEKNVPWQNKTVMLVAVVAAIAAVALNYFYISGIETKNEAQLIPIWRLKNTVPAGRRLTEQDVEEARIPAPKEEDGKPFVRSGTNSEFASIKNIPIRRRVGKGEPLRWDMFTGQGGDRAAEDAISPLWRAMTIDIDGRSASPLIRPGSKVDLHGLLTLPGSDDKPLPPNVEPLLEEVEVLAVGPIWRPEDYRPGQTGANFTKLTILVPGKLIPDLATILRLIPPPVVALRNPTETTRDAGTPWETQAGTLLREFKKKAQSQKIPFDRGVGGADRL